ncbi:substrate-binding domain-containing protein [Paraglaciecola aquimarina]|uniref:Substrate-binding domain-containing protein n=1 Tax=Paraglaciecola aquimarina TaxID=1235557 RepID=A0ABU3ST61_9ALTE|nr:substrate-binding domain-containing protein [Paraglaciecola aquimarina]MDU0353157.1 substrate-binding domain-containing protein [Paraglaciecola aquimarina]
MHIKKLNIKPNWTFVDEQGNELSPVLFRLLAEIKHSNKLTAAAVSVGISYRSAWNLIQKSSCLFGMPLVELHKGRGAKLSLLGEKLLWSKHRVSARLGPQLDNLTSELNKEIQQILVDVKPALRIHASHGYAVSLLADYSETLPLALQYKSIEDALTSLSRGDCEFAGFDVPMVAVSEKMKGIFRKYLRVDEYKIVSFVTRQQGLILQPDNPKNIQSINDLTRTDVKFINRQRDSGTRSLLDELLRAAKLSSADINGFVEEEYTHSAVAAYIASGMADVGLGIEAAARHFGLSFLPLAAEFYLLVCKNKTLQQPLAQQLIDTMQSKKFIHDVAVLPGYTPNNCGEITKINQKLDWF